MANTQNPKPAETKAEPKPTTTVKLGEMLHYRVGKDDANERNDLRKTAAHQHQGHKLDAGEVVPFIVTKLGNDGKFNGQAFLDGNDSLWVKNVTLGDEDGQCARPKG
jgi:hypothetical protein